MNAANATNATTGGPSAAATGSSDPVGRHSANAAASCPFHAAARLLPSVARGVPPVHPPGPRGLPLLGCGPELARDPLAFFTRLRDEFGDVARFDVLHVRAWFLASPEWIGDFLTDGESFVKGRALRVGRQVLGDGLLTAEGATWRRHRKLAQPAFHRARLDAYGPEMVRSTLARLETYRHGEVRDLSSEMAAITLDVAARTFFGADVRERAGEVGRALGVALREFPRLLNPVRRALLPVLPTRRSRELRGAVETLDRVILDILASRRQSPREHGDLLSMLLSARDDEGSGLTDRELRDEVMTLLLAGHETTAVSLTWTLWLLARHPEVEEWLLSELRAVLGGAPPTAADAPRLHYLDAVIKESMRLYPPAWSIGRQAARDVSLAGFRIRQGDTVVVSPWVTHRDPRYFEEPLEFRPERWLTGLGKRLPRFAYLPFGAGPRSCIGASFAMLEAALVLATLLPRFSFAPVSSSRLEPRPSLTLRPMDGLPAVVRRR